MVKRTRLAAKLSGAAKSDAASQRRRTAHMIAKFAGSHWREAQRAKWIIDMVVAIDNEYRQNTEAQRKHIDALEGELSRAYNTIESMETESNAKVASLTNELKQTTCSTTEANQKVLATEALMRNLQNELNQAETAVLKANTECVQLRKEVMLVSEAGSKIRCNLANRAHLLRENLLHTKCDIRQKRKSLRDRGLELWRSKTHSEKFMDETKQNFQNIEQEKALLLKRISKLSLELTEARNMADHAANLMGKRYKCDDDPTEETSKICLTGENFDLCGVLQ